MSCSYRVNQQLKDRRKQKKKRRRKKKKKKILMKGLHHPLIIQMMRFVTEVTRMILDLCSTEDPEQTMITHSIRLALFVAFRHITG